MKKSFKLWLMAAAVVSLSLSVASCKPDDDLTPEEKAEKENAEKVAQASKFWDIVGQLVSLDDYTVDYADKKFEPTIGEPDNGNALTRVVYVNSMEAAARSFAYLVGIEKDFDENTATYTFKDKEVGTLSYTKTNDGSQWATVDVDIKQIPHLSKIIYRSPQQNDTNASFGGGTAYYRFGDVIYRTITAANGQQTKEYWVCVRPSFDPEGKGDSHWATVSPLPKENVWEYKGSNGKTYRLPQNLGTNKEHMQNFAELIFAICSPEAWSNNVDANSTSGLFGPSGLPIFHDFNIKNKKYHNQAFWQEVKDAWLAKNVAPNLLGIVPGALETQTTDQAQGIRFLYNKAAWNTWFDNGPTLYEARYYNGQALKSNCHSVEFKTYQDNVIDKKVPENNYDFDVTQLMTNETPFIRHQKFFGDNVARFVVRFATGKELGGGSYNPQMAIPGFSELYRYNTVYGVENLLAEPHVSGGAGTVEDDITKQNRNERYAGIAHYRFGEVYKDEEGSKWVVVWSAGLEDVDKSPFSYLISFDNIKSSLANQRFTNLGNFDATLRGAYFIIHLSNQYVARGKKWQTVGDVSKSEMNIDWGANLIPMWWTFSNDPRLNATTLCVPYDGGSEAGQQMMRVQYNTIDWEGNNAYTSVWTNYPTEVFPDKQPTAFSGLPILIQDIASPELVARYANERVAKMGIQYPKNQETKVPRQIRTQTDERANNIENYKISPVGYNYFASPQPPLSIWNDPILAFRATKVYDRGNLSYSTKAENGSKLTLVKSPEYWDDFEGVNHFYHYCLESFGLAYGDLVRYCLLNGQKYDIDWNK